MERYVQKEHFKYDKILFVDGFYDGRDHSVANLPKTIPTKKI